MASVSLRCVRVCSYLGACVDGGAVMFENIMSYLGKGRCDVCACLCVLIPARVSMAEPLCLKTLRLSSASVSLPLS